MGVHASLKLMSMSLAELLACRVILVGFSCASSFLVAAEVCRY